MLINVKIPMPVQTYLYDKLFVMNERTATKNPVNIRKLLFNFFDIKETTSKGKRWVRVKHDTGVKWV